MRFTGFGAIALAVGAALAFTSPATAQSDSTGARLLLESRSEQQIADGGRTRVIVRFAHTPVAFDGLSPAEADAALAETIDAERDAVFRRVFAASAEDLAAAEAGEARLHRAFDFTPAAAMYLTRNEIEALAADPGVVRIETDGLNRPTLSESLPQIGAAILHATGARGEGSTIAVLDTGIHYTHPAFAGRIARSACFSSSVIADGTRSACIGRVTSDTSNAQAARACFPGERVLECDHGTHVASIAAGAPGTAPGVAEYSLTGVAPGARIVPVQVFSELYLVPNDCPSGSRCPVAYDSDLIAALEWLYANRNSLDLTSINMSLGGEPFTGACDDEPIAEVIGHLRNAGIATVIAAGNESARGQMSPPACVTESVSVAALSTTGRRASFSNVSELTDFFAPGADITAAGFPEQFQSTATFSGTSMAAPHVAGSLALLHSIFPAATLGQIETALRETGPAVTWNSDHPAIPGLRLDLAAARLSEELGEMAAIDVSPGSEALIQGDVSGPQSYSTARFELHNTGNTVVNWTLHSEAEWLAFSHASSSNAADDAYEARLSGSLQPGQRTDVVVSVAGSFTEGEYSAAVVFGGVGVPVFRTVRLLVHPLAPPNDDIANAFPLFIDDSGYQFSGPAVRLARATLEPGEPLHDGAQNSIWFYFDPPETQDYAIVSTAHSTTVYSTSDLSALSSSRIGEYGTGSHNTRRIDFRGEYGQRVYVAVAGVGTDHASVGVGRQSPFDNRAGVGPHQPVWLAGRSGRVLRDLNLGHIMLDGEPELGRGESYREWFAWTAQEGGTIEVADRFADTRRTTGLDIFTRTDGASAHAESDPWSMLELVASVNWTDQPDPPGSDDSETRVLQFEAEAGRTYWIRTSRSVDGGLDDWRFSWGAPRVPDHALRGAVLPNSRTVLFGRPGTAFMTLINPARFPAARNCRIGFTTFFGGHFEYRLTDSNNAPYGDPNPVFDLEPGASQSFVLSFTASSPSSQEPPFTYLCDNVVPREDPRGADQFVLRTSAAPEPDIIAIAITPTQDGVINVPKRSVFRAFSVAAMNIGAAIEEVPVRLEQFSLHMEVCETNPQTGECISARTPYLNTSFAQNQVRTFSVFVRGDDIDVPFTPATFRARIFFGANSIDVYGGTSVAIRLTDE